MKTKLHITLSLCALFALAQTSFAFACACCTNPGQRYVENTKLLPFQRNIIDELRFTKQANLFVGERDAADIKGIINPAETYTLALTRQNDRFVFSFRDEKKNEGSLTLVVPDSVAIFEIDPREGDTAAHGLGPVLYKEWRLTAPFAGTGVFKAGNGGYQRITLILQGRGRNCPEAGQFTHWTISVHGPLGNYLFYGELEKQ